MVSDSPIHDMLVRGYEVRMLDEWFEREAGCQAVHESVKNCSGDVAGLAVDRHKGRRLVCTATVEHQRRAFAAGHWCRGCEREGVRRLAADCWRIIPV